MRTIQNQTVCVTMKDARGRPELAQDAFHVATKYFKERVVGKKTVTSLPVATVSWDDLM